MNRRDFLNNTSLASLAFLSNIDGSILSSGDKLEITGSRSIFPVDNRNALINPQMGWTLHYYSNSIKNYGSRLQPEDVVEDFPGLSTVYLRLPWAYIEPEEGKFNWEIFDTPAQRWIDAGKKVAMRITAEESSIRFATPRWVFEAGAKGISWGKNNLQWEPDFNDPIFLEKVENFIGEMALRYDGNPNISFIDIGHFGLWGEGHTVHSTHINYSLDVLKRYIDIYTKAFKKTLLCISDDFVGHDKPGFRFPITDYAFSKGVTIRDDSILVQNYGLPMPPWDQTEEPKPWYHSEMAQLFWPTLPVILEHEHYGMSVRRKAWDKALFLKSVEEYHASYMSIHWWPREFLDDNRDVIEKINLRLGYRIQIKSIELPTAIQIGKPFNFKAKWANAGVAPCYPGGYPCITLKNSNGGIISVLVDESFNVRTLPVSTDSDIKPVEQNSIFTISPLLSDPLKDDFVNMLSGDYRVFISVGRRDGTPIIELPYDKNDGKKRYEIGMVTLTKR